MDEIEILRKITAGKWADWFIVDRALDLSVSRPTSDFTEVAAKMRAFGQTSDIKSDYSGRNGFVVIKARLYPWDTCLLRRSQTFV